MATMTGPVDYAKTYFLHPTLTTIHGEPDYPALKQLKLELKANASRVTSDLGGGGHGHLGLVLTPRQYSMISAILYTHPVHSGQLNIPTGTTQHESVRLTLAHAEVIRVYRKTVELEKALINLTCKRITRSVLAPTQVLSLSPYRHFYPGLFYLRRYRS